MPYACPRCSSEFAPVGEGTERVESALAARFPKAPLVRVDRDVIRRRGELEQAQKAFEASIKLDQRNVEAFVGLGETALRQKRLDEAAGMGILADFPPGQIHSLKDLMLPALHRVGLITPRVQKKYEEAGIDVSTDMRILHQMEGGAPNLEAAAE